ncbi:MAG TPA: WYL domain-containing protein [Planctomycetota bacterium]|nr:WYL domain-containing protein [Planctomycetota bacterium]
MGRRKESRNRQLVRILQLLNLLSNNPAGYTIAELLSRLRAGRRTLYRDIEALAASGIFLEREEILSREVRHKLPHEYRFVKTTFDENELFSLFFAKNLLKPLEGTPFGRGIESALDKIYKLLPADVQNYCFFTESYFVFRQPFLRSYKEFEANIRALREAILRDRVCEIEYHKDDRSDRHTIHPYFVTYVDGLLYVIAFSEQRREKRTFRIDRIDRIRVLAKSFERPPDFRSENFDPERILGRTLKIYGDETVHPVVISFPRTMAERVRERTWHASQKISDGPGGRVILSMELPITPEVVSWILSFGPQARVLKPPRLVDEVSRELKQAARQYA